MTAAGGTDIVLQSVETFSGAYAEFQWSQLSGPSVNILDADTEYARFTAPTVVDDTDLVFTLASSGTVIDLVRVRIVPTRTERVLAALVDFEDVNLEERPFSREDIVKLLESNDDSLRAFISLTSRNLVDVDFDVLDWITVNKNKADYSLHAAEFESVADAVSRMSESVDLGEYDKVMPFIFPLQQGYPGCAAYLDRVSWDTPNGEFELGAAWLSGYDMSCVAKGRISHEFGHTFGFVHSYGIECEKDPPMPGSTIDPTDLNDSCYANLCPNDDCTKTYQGDSRIIANSDFDMLGGDHDERYENFFPVHFHAAWQALAGWLTAYQVLTPDNPGEYYLTTLESLTPAPKALKVFLGDDHTGTPQYYWLQTREFSPCKVDVRLQASNVFSDGAFSDSAPFDTYYVDGWIFDSHTPFRDLHRGIRVDVLDCESGKPGNAVRLKVSFTGLDVDPEIAAVFDSREANTITLTNNGSESIDVGSASIGGRHPAAFAIDSDECGDSVLRPKASCTIAVRATTSETQTHRHGLLKIPNSDELAPDAAVSLLQIGDPTQLPDACVEHISPGSIIGSWNSDCVSATWNAQYYARFYTFALETETNVSISVDSEEIPKLFLYSSEDVGGATLAESIGDSGYIENLALQPGAYTMEVTTYRTTIGGDFTLTLVSTPTPTSWFDNPPDAAHSAALEAIEGIEDLDPGIGAAVAALSWVVDGIDWSEVGVLQGLHDLTHEDRELVRQVVSSDFRQSLLAPGLEPVRQAAEYEWLADGLDAREVRALTSIARIAEHAPDAAGRLLGFGWLADHVSFEESLSLHTIHRILTETGIAGRVLDFAWLDDGIIRSERVALEHLRMLANDDPELASRALGYAWLADGVTSAEQKALFALSRVAGAAGPSRSYALDETSVPRELASAFGWLADGLDANEVRALIQVASVGEKDSGIYAELLGYSWLADGVSEKEADAVEHLCSIMARDAEVGRRMVGEGLLDDPLSDRDLYAAGSIQRLTSRNRSAATALVGQPWFADGLDDEEVAFVAALGEAAVLW